MTSSYYLMILIKSEETSLIYPKYIQHKGIIFNLKQNSSSCNLLKLLADFLKDRKQRVVLNGQVSNQADVALGVPQGSILSPLLFLIYINDLANSLSYNAKLFANGTSLFSVTQNKTNTFANEMNNDLAKMNNWDENKSIQSSS